MSTSQVREIPLEKIFIGKVNVRKDLGDLLPLISSIKEKGVLQPILVRPVEDKFEVVCGARRVEAAKGAGLKTIPAIVRELSDREAIVISLTENLQRNNLQLEEKVEGYMKIMQINSHVRTPEDLSKILNVSPNTIRDEMAAYEALLKLRGAGEKIEVKVAKPAVISKERKKSKVIPIKHAADLERVFKKVEEKIPKEEREKKFVELAKAIAPLERGKARKVLNHFVAHPEKSVEEIKREVLKVHDIPVTVSFSPKVFSGLVKAAEEREITVEQLVRNIVRDWLRRGGYLAESKNT